MKNIIPNFKIAGATEHNRQVERQEDILRKQQNHNETINAYKSIKSSLDIQTKKSKRFNTWSIALSITAIIVSIATLIFTILTYFKS